MISGVGEELFFCPSTGGFKSLRAMAYHPETERPLRAPQPELRDRGLRSGRAPARRWGHRRACGVAVRITSIRMHRTCWASSRPSTSETGQTKWRQRRRAPYNTATLTTAGGLVFVGDWDRYVFAYDAESGRRAVADASHHDVQRVSDQLRGRREAVHRVRGRSAARWVELDEHPARRPAPGAPQPARRQRPLRVCSAVGAVSGGGRG